MIATALKSDANRPMPVVVAPPPLIQALLNPACYDHNTGPIRIIETHISWVLLTGRFAYKIKKTLKLAFLDFSTLERRRHCCEEEMRLNHRNAPELYLGIVDITGSPNEPRINGHGPVIEYAVKMLQFGQAQRLDNVLSRNGLEPRHLTQLAHDLARVHRQAAVIHPSSGFANVQRLREDCQQNFDSVAGFVDPELDPYLPDRIRNGSECSLLRLETSIETRRMQGFIRECHGDLHLENLVLHQCRVRAFDCIEFNETLRWIDVISDVAFLIMDLDWRGRPDLSRVFLSAYLEQSGDYTGLALLCHYQMYRAMVRAKVAMIRLRQGNLTPAQQGLERTGLISHLHLAEGYTHKRPPVSMILTHGLSGSGKSWLAAELALRSGAIRIRSDTERKRCITGDLYTEGANRKVYQRLATLAETILTNAYSVIVDATFLHYRQRRMFRALARRLGVGFVIVHTRAEPEILEQRILGRYDDPSDATLDVLTQQYTLQETPADDEADTVLRIDTQDTGALKVAVEHICQTRALNPKNH